VDELRNRHVVLGLLFRHALRFYEIFELGVIRAVQNLLFLGAELFHPRTDESFRFLQSFLIQIIEGVIIIVFRTELERMRSREKQAQGVFGNAVIGLIERLDQIFLFHDAAGVPKLLLGVFQERLRERARLHVIGNGLQGSGLDLAHPFPSNTKTAANGLQGLPFAHTLIFQAKTAHDYFALAVIKAGEQGVESFCIKLIHDAFIIYGVI
jgi:hypothetical protein